MIKVNLIEVTWWEDGEEKGWMLSDLMFPALPRKGDTIMVQVGDPEQGRDLIAEVVRVTWHIPDDDDEIEVWIYADDTDSGPRSV